MTIYTASPEQAAAMRQQRGTWLPVREVIRSAGEFAVSRYGGDNALEAYVSGLTAIGINIPNPEGSSTIYTARYERVARYAIQLADQGEADGYNARVEAAWNNFRRPGMDSYQIVRRVTTLAQARGYAAPSVYGGYLDWTSADTNGRRNFYVSVNQEYARSITTDETDRHVVKAEFDANTLQLAESVDRMIQRSAAAAGLILTADDERLGEPTTYGSVNPQRRTNALHTRVENAAANSNDLAGPDEFIATDDFLAMMRDQAIANRWCPEHHRIIERLTRNERAPYGVRAAVRFTMTQEFTSDLTSFYGSEGSPDRIRERIREQLAYVQQIAGAGSNINFTVNEHTADVHILPCDDDYERPADHIPPSEVDAGPATNAALHMQPWSLDLDQDQDYDPDADLGVWCEECNEYHDE